MLRNIFEEEDDEIEEDDTITHLVEADVETKKLWLGIRVNKELLTTSWVITRQ